MRHLLLVGVLGLLTGGCDTLREHFINRAIDRAAFELRCPRERLTLHGLGTRLEDRVYAPERGTQVGVSGCGRRAVYIYTGDTGWILNSDSHPAQQ